MTTPPQRERPPRRPTSPDGVIVVDKPQGVTSHDVVARLRRLCGTRAVGHGGTLDPMATGVLVCGIGKGTKLLSFVSGSDKAYTATIRLGISTTTDDAEGEIAAAPGALFASQPTLSSERISSCDPEFPPSSCAESQDLERAITKENLLTAIAKLTGSINQVPTSVSAIKVDGKRAYDLVRQGEQVELKARPVTVSEFEVVKIETAVERSRKFLRGVETVGPVPVIDLSVNVVVSSGTYVRALARDLGADLGTGGHLTMLRRTRIGNVSLGQAQTLEQLAELGDAANEQGRPLATIPLGDAAKMFLPTRQVTEDQAKNLSQGKYIDKANTDQVTAALTADNRLVAIIEPATHKLAKPKVVFPWEP